MVFYTQVDQGAPTNTHHVKLETALEELPFNLGGDAVETNMAARENGSRGGRGRGSSGSHGGERTRRLIAGYLQRAADRINGSECDD